jgi:hypothetical protein
MRNTDATHLPSDVFSTPGLILEVIQALQFNDLNGDGTLESADPAGLMALPVRAAFKYRKRTGRREYVRVKLVRAADGGIDAIKHAQDVAGALTSLTETDGLIELPEDLTNGAGDDIIKDSGGDDNIKAGEGTTWSTPDRVSTR